MLENVHSYSNNHSIKYLLFPNLISIPPTPSSPFHHGQTTRQAFGWQLYLAVVGYVANSFIAMRPLGWPLKTRTDWSTVSSATIFTAMATRFMPSVDVRMSIVFIFNQVQCFLGVHRKINRHLIHVDDETPIAIAAVDKNAAHESHVISQITLNLEQQVLQCVHAHSMKK